MFMGAKADVVGIIPDSTASVDIDGSWDEGYPDYWESKVIKGEARTSG